MKTLLVIASVLTLTACAALDPMPNTTAAQRLAKTSSPEDVEFCKYEATKSAQGTYNHNPMVQGINNQEQWSNIFNSCIMYRRSTNK